MNFQIKKILFLFALILFPLSVVDGRDCQGQKILSQKTCEGDGLEAEEIKLYHMLNEYRDAHGLSAIPSSPSLSLVANRHVRDLAQNIRSYARDGLHWIHGWSNFPYDANDERTFRCMWEAPKRLKTPYPGFGFEILCGDPDVKYKDFIMSATYAFSTWKKSRLHRDVILNQGTWKSYSWKAMGIGIYKGYAAVWFGREPDPLSKKDP